MWFDARTQMVEITGKPPATSATIATNAPAYPRVAIAAIVASPLDRKLIFDLLEERYAIRKFCGGQKRVEVRALLNMARSPGAPPEALRRIFLEALHDTAETN